MDGVNQFTLDMRDGICAKAGWGCVDGNRASLFDGCDHILSQNDAGGLLAHLVDKAHVGKFLQSGLKCLFLQVEPAARAGNWLWPIPDNPPTPENHAEA